MPFPSPGDLPDPGTELVSLAAPGLVGGFFTTEPPGKSFSARVLNQLQREAVVALIVRSSVSRIQDRDILT